MDSDLEILQETLQTAAKAMFDEQLEWHPAGKWSTAEVLEHLCLTYTGTIKGFGRMLSAGAPLATRSSVKQRVQALFVFGFNYLPSGRKAPLHTMPRGLEAERIRTEMQGKIAAMDQIIQECERRFGARPLLDHPILGPLTAKQWRRFRLIHGRHHVKQIACLRQEMLKSASLPAID
jgi:hypothetical protein